MRLKLDREHWLVFNCGAQNKKNQHKYDYRRQTLTDYILCTRFNVRIRTQFRFMSLYVYVQVSSRITKNAVMLLSLL